MIPGGINPLMMAGGGDPLDELGKIDRSLRLRSSAGGVLARTPSAAGNQKTWTFSAKVKRGVLGVQQGIIEAYVSAGNQTSLKFDAGDTLSLQLYAIPTYNTVWQTTAVFREPSAWLDIVLILDTTQSAQADMAKLWVNGVQQTFGYTNLNNPIPQNSDWHVNSTAPHSIGRYNAGSPLDSCLAWPALIDGQGVVPPSFGQFHSRTNQWRPKSKAAMAALAGAGEINSFFLPLDDITNLTTLCADASSKGNNWTATNVSLTVGATYDSLLDTPTNNFSTLNLVDTPLGGGSRTFSDGNLSIYGAGNISYNFFGTGTQKISSGKRYWEVKVTNVGSVAFIGVTSDMPVSQPNSITGATAKSYVYRSDSGNKRNNAANAAYGAAFTTGDIVGVELDLDAGTLTFYKNGVSQGVAFSGLSGDFLPISGNDGSTTTQSYTYNFGQRPFVYGGSAGAKTVSTKNLSLPSFPNASMAFVAVTDSGANIAATLATARAGWPAHIEIFKRRDAAEGWRWRFSDDSANYLDSSSTAAKAAFPALAGTAYVGYALKVSAATGVASGTFAHVNGVADAITDGLGNTRKAIFLKRTDGSGSWFVYHPDLTAGKLLYLEQTAAETTDATISAVTSSGFIAAAALATGSYRWIALGELDGFLKLVKHTGNGSADGPYIASALSPALTLTKRTDAVGDFEFHDKARDPNNVSISGLYANSSAQENTGTSGAIDFLASGVKIRNANTVHNTSGATHVSLQIAAFPFRYANAR